MKAFVNTEYGSVEVLQLQEIPKPSPKANEVLIKIKATTVNRSDTGIRKAEYFIARFFTGFLKPKFHVLGSEFAGVVESIGKDVTSFNIGDEVFGLSGDTFGTHAEYLCFPEDGAIALKPQNFSFEEAAAICEGHYLALNYLQKVNLSRGHKILINGASGSIGSSAVQLAKHFGAQITAVTNTKNLALAKQLGADVVIDYIQDDFTKIDDKFDFIFDAVGKSSFFKCKRLMKEKAVYFSTELGFAYANVFLPLFTKKVLFPIPVHNKEQMEFFKTLAEAGEIRAVIDRQYPFEQIKEAHQYVELGQKTGSVVITL
ncbi:MAG: NAD(P)-dependent alcohol dehydrogenase [Spirosomataceae bacterium]